MKEQKKKNVEFYECKMLGRNWCNNPLFNYEFSFKQ